MYPSFFFYEIPTIGFQIILHCTIMLFLIPIVYMFFTYMLRTFFTFFQRKKLPLRAAYLTLFLSSRSLPVLLSFHKNILYTKTCSLPHSASDNHGAYREDMHNILILSCPASLPASFCLSSLN